MLHKVVSAHRGLVIVFPKLPKIIHLHRKLCYKKLQVAMLVSWYLHKIWCCTHNAPKSRSNFTTFGKE